jgi:nucleotide-binding universal stress UspA family protein
MTPQSLVSLCGVYGSSAEQYCALLHSRKTEISELLHCYINALQALPGPRDLPERQRTEVIVRCITDAFLRWIDTALMKTNQLKFETILVATDLQGGSTSALRYAQAIASQHGSALVILHLIDPINYAFPSGDQRFLEAHAEARNELKRIEEDIRLCGMIIDSVVESGVICDCILQAVEDHQADLLILGTKANTGTGRTALGAVARRLLARCSCSILTVPPEAEYLLSTAGCWRRILAATDFSPASLVALQCAHKIARGQLLVLHANAVEGEPTCPKHLERLRLLAPFNESHTVPVEHVAVSEDIGRLIYQQSLRFRPDLIVLGSPSSELSSDELGSSTVLEVISQATCPVLCVPAAGTSPAETPLKQEVLA